MLLSAYPGSLRAKKFRWRALPAVRVFWQKFKRGDRARGPKPTQRQAKSNHEDEVSPCPRPPGGGILGRMLPRPTPSASIDGCYVGTAANESAAITIGTTTETTEEAVIVGGRYQCFHLTVVPDEGSGSGRSGGGNPNQEEGSRRVVSHGGGRELPADPAGGW